MLVLRLFVGYNQDVEWQNEGSTGRDSRETAEFEQTVTKEGGGEARGLRFQSDEQNTYNWEKGLAKPGVEQFLALCDIYRVDDI